MAQSEDGPQVGAIAGATRGPHFAIRQTIFPTAMFMAEVSVHHIAPIILGAHGNFSDFVGRDWASRSIRNSLWRLTPGPQAVDCSLSAANSARFTPWPDVGMCRAKEPMVAARTVRQTPHDI